MNENETIDDGTKTFAARVKKLQDQGLLPDLPEPIVNHWVSEIITGRVDVLRATGIADELAESSRRLVEHLSEGADDISVSLAEVYDKYAPVFVAPDVLGAADIVLEMNSLKLRLDMDVVGPFLALARDEASYRLKLLKQWLGRGNVDDVTITPLLAGYLAQPGDFQAKLDELDRLSGETRNGRFHSENHVQRDLEYRKFSHTYSRLCGTNRRLPYVNEPQEVLYRRFVDLPELDHEHPETWRLCGQHLHEAGRIAYEAVLFLRFLMRFREGTSRPIVVVGNNRYGRQWIVEPLEEFLVDGFTLRYDGVPSHTSMRLTVPWARNFELSADNTGPWTPDAFPMEFVRQMDLDMPHIVVADGKSPQGYDGSVMLSRAAKIYANWVVAFNDVRAAGRRSVYEDESSLPGDHLCELAHWFEFVRLRRQLAEWVRPGSTYNVGLWSPRPTEMAELGEIHVPYKPPQLDTDRPQFVLANPIVYDAGALPDGLRDTSPYYFDGPEKHVQEEIVFGFGSYGFQPAVRGTMTATFVAAVQRAMKEEVARMMPN